MYRRLPVFLKSQFTEPVSGQYRCVVGGAAAVVPALRCTASARKFSVGTLQYTGNNNNNIISSPLPEVTEKFPNITSYEQLHKFSIDQVG